VRLLKHMVAGTLRYVHVPEYDEDLQAFWDFMAQGDQYLAVDTESTGLDLFSDEHKLRLVQIGNDTDAWVLRFDRFPEVCRQALSQERTWIAHNAPFDALTLDRHGVVKLELFLPRCWDTKILAHLMDPRGKEEGGIGLGLKEQSAKHVDPAAPDTSNGLTKVFNSFGWTKSTGWARISADHSLYQLYAGLDVILCHLLFQKLHRVAMTMVELCKFEHRLQYLVTLMQRRGMLLDIPYVHRLVIDLHNEYVDQCDAAFDLGVENVYSNTQVLDKLQEMGEVLTERTEKGQLKVDMAVLTPLADLDRQWQRIGAREPNPLAEAVIRAKRAKKWSSAYAEAFLENRDAHDRLHPRINSLQARTARMCLPESELLLTRRGSLASCDVVVGDETIDQDGRWTRVTAVHRYPAQRVVEYRQPDGRYVLRSTDNHRWLQYSERKKWYLAPISASRRTLVLAPPRQDAFGTEFLADTPGQQLATIVGMLATDGRLWSPPDGSVGLGARALLYQTEKSFYDQLVEVVPKEWISYDKITTAGELHHEISLRMRAVRPVLEPLGLMPGPGSVLADHPGLEAWVRELPLEDVAAFFRAVYMADGSTASGNHVISIKPPALMRAVRLAAYRLGWLSSVQWAKPSEWSNGPRSFLSFRRALWTTRGHTETETVADVWCVTTESGTFTAEGELGFYLTGNSIDNPALQQLPSGDWRIRRCFIPDPGHVMIAADYQAVEMRVLAALSGDWTMRNAIKKGLDLHSFTAAAVQGIPLDDFMALLDAKDGHAQRLRKIAKAIGFGKVYGGGAATISRQTGADEDSVKVALKAYDTTFPGIRRYSTQLVNSAKQGLMEVVTPIGRRLPLDEDRLYAATNYMVQSTARDLLAKAVVKVFEAGLGEYLLLPVHDELLGQAPVESAEEIINEIGRVMESTFQGVEILSDPKVVGPSWGAAYKAPAVLPAELPVRKERKLRAGEWAQESLDLGV
jgi:DNA polymerase I-like protein with 3'-5' exonuclease and polymerase domains